MRIAIVSAHYPPNFVSGGTLVPARIARTLADRGHQVFVFAGEVLEGEPDLLVRVEDARDEGGHGATAGIETTWLTVTSRLGWEDERNFRSGPVQQAFLAFLRRVQPDVVHLHTLQGLGGDLVSLAAASGSATVITLHDMWWWCARQFLVEKDLTPCPTVVDLGVCPCAVDNGWLRARNAALAPHLAAADLVLAPSSSMVTLLAANGVAPDRLALDENPAPAAVRTAPQRPPRVPGAPVRFVFAGGPYPVKGGPLALAAARRLADVPGWTLDLYGFSTREVLPPGVRALPAYPADEAATVLAGADVLVMSSVMLESYSLLTREALAAGCVVISGDNPGPVEVVRHGVNGLVVPRGDEEALAAAMRSLVVDPQLLESLRPAAGGLRLRTLEEQADGLEEHYARILAARPAPGLPAPAPLQRVLVVSGIDGAPLRYRGQLPAEALRTIGVHVDVRMYRDPSVATLAERADAVVLYRVPATVQVVGLVTGIRERGDVPVLFDVDDLIVDPGLAAELDPVLTAVPGLDLALYWQGVRRYRTTLEACDGYIGSTPYLCRRVSELTGLPTYRFANGVGRELGRVSDAAVRRPRRPGPVRMGYFSGTNTHNEDWASIEPAVVQVLTERPEVQLWVGGLLDTSAALAPFADRVRRLPVTPWFDLPALLRDVDINLAPLEAGRTFNEAKSAIKYLEAALVGTVTVASPSEPFREAIEPGVTGLLAADLAQWRSALLGLVDDPALRHRLGRAAREHVTTTLSPPEQGHRYLAILQAARQALADGTRRPMFGDFPPEVTDEPWTPTATQYYGALEIRPDGRVRPAEQLGVTGLLRRYSDAARTMLAEQGVLATLRRGVSVSRRLRRQGLARLRR